MQRDVHPLLFSCKRPVYTYLYEFSTTDEPNWPPAAAKQAKRAALARENRAGQAHDAGGAIDDCVALV